MNYHLFASVSSPYLPSERLGKESNPGPALGASGQLVMATPTPGISFSTQRILSLGLVGPLRFCLILVREAIIKESNNKFW